MTFDPAFTPLNKEKPSKKEQTFDPAFTPFMSLKPIGNRKVGYGERFERGLNQSATGQLNSLAGEVGGFGRTNVGNPENEIEPSFTEDLTQMAGTFIGDLPAIIGGGALGGAVGGVAGSSTGSPFAAGAGATLGTGFGAMGMPAFIKQSVKEYQNFQDQGGDLTFGDWLDTLANPVNHAIREGSLGTIAGMAKQAVPYLRKIPGVDKFLNTKYVGKTAESAAVLGAEAGSVVTSQAASERRLPKPEDYAKASIIMATGRAGELPETLHRYMKGSKDYGVDYELAQKLKKQNLSYPPLQEMQGKTDTVWKNNLGLDQNIAQFDESYTKTLVKKIEDLSPRQYESANDAGVTMRDLLLGETRETQKTDSQNLSERIRESLTEIPLPPETVRKSQNAEFESEPQGTPYFNRTPLNARVSRLDELSSDNMSVLANSMKNSPPNKMVKPETQQYKPPVLQEPEAIQKPRKISRPLLENPVTEVLETISSEPFNSDAEAGAKIRHVFNKNRSEIEKPLNRRFTQLEENTAKVEANSAFVRNEINQFIDNFDQSHIPTPQEQQLKNAATNLQRLFSRARVEDVDGQPTIVGYENINMRELIATNRSLKKLPDWEAHDDIRKNINRLTNRVDEFIIEALEAEMPNIAREYEQLTTDYRIFKERFDNQVTDIFRKSTESAEGIYNKFTSLDAFNQLNQAMRTSEEGQSVMNQLRREVWRKRIGEDATNAHNEPDFTKSISRLDTHDFQNLMNFLEPEQRAQVNTRLQEIQGIRDMVEIDEATYQRLKDRYDIQKAIENNKVKQEKRTKGIQKAEATKIKTAEADAKKKADDFKKRMKERQELIRHKKFEPITKLVQQKVDLMTSLLEKDPEALLKNMNTIENIRLTKKVCSQVKGGKELYDSLARFTTEDMFSFVKDAYVEGQRIPFDRIKVKMQQREFRAKLIELNGLEWVKSVDELVSVSDQLSKGFKDKIVKYKDDPQTAMSIFNIGTMLGVIHGTVAAPQAAVGVAAKSALSWTSNWWLNKKNYNQKVIKQAIAAAKALRDGDKKDIQQAERIFKVSPFAFNKNDKDDKE